MIRPLTDEEHCQMAAGMAASALGIDVADPPTLGGRMYEEIRRLQAAVGGRDAAIRAIVGELRAEVVGQVDPDVLGVLTDVLGEGWADVPWCSCDGQRAPVYIVGAEARAHAIEVDTPSRFVRDRWPEWWGSVVACCTICDEVRMEGGQVVDEHGDAVRTVMRAGEDESDAGRCWCGAGPDDSGCLSDGSEPCPYNPADGRQGVL